MMDALGSAAARNTEPQPLHPASKPPAAPRAKEYTRDSVLAMSNGSLADRLLDHAAAYHAVALQAEATGDRARADVHRVVASVFEGALIHPHGIRSGKREYDWCEGTFYPTPISARLALTLFEHAVVKTFEVHPNALRAVSRALDGRSPHVRAWQSFTGHGGLTRYQGLIAEHEGVLEEHAGRSQLAGALCAGTLCIGGAETSVYLAAHTTAELLCLGPLLGITPAGIGAFVTGRAAYALAVLAYRPAPLHHGPDVQPLVDAYRAGGAPPTQDRMTA